jgi:hypothetical protein
VVWLSILYMQIRSIILLAVAVYESLIQVIVSACASEACIEGTNGQAKNCSIPLLHKYHLKMEEEPAIGNIASQLRKVPLILSLAFIETLDWKAHPLLVVLSAHDGKLEFNSICVVDTAAYKLYQYSCSVPCGRDYFLLYVIFCQKKLKDLRFKYYVPVTALAYELASVECFALDLKEKKIHKGPWKIRYGTFIRM